MSAQQTATDFDLDASAPLPQAPTSVRSSTSSTLLIRGLTLAAVTAATLAGSVLLELPAAQATPRTVIVTTGAGPLNVREGAGTNTRLLRTIPNGSRVTIVCYLQGQTFTGGPFRVSTNIWNRLDNGGYVTDAMLETGSNNPVVPSCNAPAPSGRATGKTRAYNAGVGGQCTWGAFEKWFEATSRRNYPALSGNAKDWAASARATGWTVVADGQPRSIVVFQPGVQYADTVNGHVAWVDSTSRRADGLYITITEMNYGGHPGQWHQRTIKDIPGMSYILLP